MKHLTDATVGGTVYPVNIRYSKRNPHSLYFTFVTASPKTWVLDREMVRDGLGRMVGEGDVRITPGPVTIGIHLSSPDGDALAVFHKAAIVEALRESAGMVPFGNEELFMDWSGIPRPEVAS